MDYYSFVPEKLAEKREVHKKTGRSFDIPVIDFRKLQQIILRLPLSFLCGQVSWFCRRSAGTGHTGQG